MPSVDLTSASCDELAGRRWRSAPAAPCSAQVHFGIGKRRGVARQLTAHLVQRRLIGPRIDLGQHIAGLDHLAFGEIDLDQHAADLRAHRSGGQRRHGAQRIERDIDVARYGARDAHRLRALIDHAATGVVAGRIDRPDQQRQERQPDREPHHARQARIVAAPALHATPAAAHETLMGTTGSARRKSPGERSIFIGYSVANSRKGRTRQR